MGMEPTHAELRSWLQQSLENGGGYPPNLFHACRLAYAAGADAELKATCRWLHGFPVIYCSGPKLANELRAARRPKPPSLKQLKQQSLALIDKIQGNKGIWQTTDLDVVRRALEALPEDES